MPARFHRKGEQDDSIVILADGNDRRRSGLLQGIEDISRFHIREESPACRGGPIRFNIIDPGSSINKTHLLPGQAGQNLAQFHFFQARGKNARSGETEEADVPWEDGDDTVFPEWHSRMAWP